MLLADDTGTIRCTDCKREVFWDDCTCGDEFHHTIYCPKCGDEQRDCDDVTKCNRCDTKVSFDEVSDGYYAVCPTHDEDLYQFETYKAGV